MNALCLSNLGRFASLRRSYNRFKQNHFLSSHFSLSLFACAKDGKVFYDGEIENKSPSLEKLFFLLYPDESCARRRRWNVDLKSQHASLRVVEATSERKHHRKIKRTSPRKAFCEHEEELFD